MQHSQNTKFPLKGWCWKTNTCICYILTGLLQYIVLWPPSTNLKWQRVQNAAARLLTRTRKYDHITSTLVSLHWLPIQARADFKVILLTYKSLHGLAPLYLSGLLAPYSPIRSLRSQDAGYLVVPKIFFFAAGRRAFSCKAPLLWNKLPVSIK